MNESATNTISKRCKTVTKLINEKFWGISSDTKNSLYVGSYGRETAISTSDIDILVCLPESEYIHFNTIKGNSQSRLLQAVRQNILSIYPTSNVRADGQVVIIEFSDNIKFEILPAFRKYDMTYRYPDSNMGGRWLSTKPEIEQEAIKTKNFDTDGLLINTCKYMRYIRDNYFSSYHLSGIVIDSFVYNALAYNIYNKFTSTYSYHSYLLNYFKTLGNYITTPGGKELISMSESNFCLEKVLNCMVLTAYYIKITKKENATKFSQNTLRYCPRENGHYELKNKSSVIFSIIEN